MKTATDEIYFSFCYKFLIYILLFYVLLIGAVNSIIVHHDYIVFLSNLFFYAWPPNAYIQVSSNNSILNDTQASEFFFDRSLLSFLLLTWLIFCIFFKISSRRNLTSIPMFIFTSLMSAAMFLCACDGIHEKIDLYTLGSHDNLFVLVSKSTLFIFGFYFSLHFSGYLACSGVIRAFRKLTS
ncbi:hypothetical protein GA0061101_113139 [Rhizobium lusitanum]|jgi:hypothetical protein|uniref:Uncharacterized protein n=1 Tax=Rhizobium lusitanum TaxID=293958 RepID=A0A1C3WMR0_9HYPH|nr:hypothetical protein GA0061101_113139 [Rhizobium lusitanum]